MKITSKVPFKTSTMHLTSRSSCHQAKSHFSQLSPVCRLYTSWLVSGACRHWRDATPRQTSTIHLSTHQHCHNRMPIGKTRSTRCFLQSIFRAKRCSSSIVSPSVQRSITILEVLFCCYCCCCRRCRGNKRGWSCDAVVPPLLAVRRLLRQAALLHVGMAV